MSINNPFGMEIDDDGLPKYSPDRKNIAAYHMYRLGLTDKLPDPEDTHTPFFRTPSYYEEKAEKERLSQSGSPAPFETRPAKPETSDFVNQPPSQTGEKPVFPDPAVKQEPVQPDAGMPSAGQNRHREITDGTDFGRHVLKHIFGERRPPYQNPSPDFRLSGQTSPAPIREEPAAPAQTERTAPPLRSQPVQRQRHVSRPAQEPIQPENTTPRPSGTGGTSDTAKPPSLAGNIMNTINQAFGQFNNAATVDDIREMYGFPKTPRSSGQSTNKTGSSAQTAPSIPDCSPLPTNPIKPANPILRKGWRLISPQMSEEVNNELTRKNECRPIGINSSQLSIYEGGSREKAYVPYSAKTAKGNRSGVTIGSGFDLGQRKHPDELRAMGLPESLVQKYAPYLGKQKMDAVNFLKNHPLKLSQDEIDTVNRCVLIDLGKKAIRHWNTEIDKQRKTWPDAPYFHEMNTNQQTIIFSRYYHEGAGWIKRHPEIHQSIVQNDWESVRNHWNNLIDKYGKAGQQWKADRLKSEYKYLWPETKRK
ncbi:pesticin C-terminus-like muramidase [Oxalobacter formigenes]